MTPDTRSSQWTLGEPESSLLRLPESHDVT